MPVEVFRVEQFWILIPFAVTFMLTFIAAAMSDSSVRPYYLIFGTTITVAWDCNQYYLFDKAKQWTRSLKKVDTMSVISVSSYTAAQVQAIVIYPCLPLFMTLCSYGYTGFAGFQMLEFIGELIAKGLALLVLARDNLDTLSKEHYRLEAVVKDMVKVVSQRDINITQVLDDEKSDISSYLIAQFAGIEQLQPTEKQRRTTFTPSSRLTSRKPTQPHALRDWEFESLDLLPNELLHFVLDVMLDLKVEQALQVPQSALKGFVVDLAQLYNDVPFHNFEHASLVFHTAYMMLLAIEIDWTPLESAAVLLAALCHDLDHRGFNNAHHVRIGSDLAIKYNDQSVLENHHCATMFTLMDKHGLLARLPKDDVRRLRKMMIDIIMGTDMAQHASLLAKVANADAATMAHDDNNRQFLLVVLVHAADLYNAVKPFSSAKRWTTRLYKEFNFQCEVERSLGLEPAAFMTARTLPEIVQGQKAFYSYVALPWFKQTGTLFPALKFLADICQANLDAWSQLDVAECPV
eukprot:TRINITY_DN10656_c0_g1_i1.p1 TRINITY_DN10656_c0_g1~~TRINITY_DN10656_c0_g1_i1.p1  ORF type:complete len:605 (+),score=151.11 TRINITY_DN10656_c0_g1_i1:261-1817(+)